jgi:hypothetical protein
MVSMREEAELEYGKMKAFLAFYVERYFLNLETLPPEKWPIASLEALEKKGMIRALKGHVRQSTIVWKCRFILTTRRSRA